MCVQTQPQAITKALPGRPYGGKLPFPHHTWCTSRESQSLKESQSGTQAPLLAMLICMSAFLAQVPLFTVHLPDYFAEAFLRHLFRSLLIGGKGE